MELALRVFHATRDYQIRLNVVWIPRALNEQADYFSRVTDCDDWGVQTAVVRRMESWWGPFDVDRFANAENTHCARFNSRFWAPDTEAVDAFTQDWSRDHNLLVPPIYLITKTIRYMEMCHARGVMVFPRWEAASFWPEVVSPLGGEETVHPTGGTYGQHISPWA